jgi:cytochrome c oxidase assembly protein subunit 11
MSQAARNEVLLRKLLVIVTVMLAFSFALVPFYRKICEVTGINQTRVLQSPATNSQVDMTRLVTVELVANNSAGLRWEFEPLQTSVQVHPGELTQIEYQVVNTTGHRITAQAVPSYGPAVAGRHFRKVECFCFKRQSFAPFESRRLPVVFLLSPELPREVRTVTLSYTFFEVPAETGNRG